MIKKYKTKIKDLYVFQNKTYKDKRGYFKEILKEKLIKQKFPFKVMSYSKQNVIRGLHLQKKKTQGKFVTVVKGKIFDVVIDFRKKSKTFGKKFTIILSEKNSKSIYVPPGFAHGFCALEKHNYVIYSCTNYRNKVSETGIIYNDKTLDINWPIKKPIVSNKDKTNLTYINFIKSL